MLASSLLRSSLAILAVTLAGCGARSELITPAPREPDAGVVDEGCVADGVTYIYVVTSSNELLRFDPEAATFTPIGTLACNDPTGSTPFSMGVDREGTAYVVFSPSGALYKVSTATAICEPTIYFPGQSGFVTMGMGFSTDEGGPEEKLFVAESNFETPSRGLATVDTETYVLDFVAPFSPTLGTAVELTGTGDDRLYGFFIDAGTPNTNIAQIDKATGELFDISPVQLATDVSSFAFAFWGGDFYMFHAAIDGPTIVTRFDPDDQSTAQVASLPTHVVGVGVSTCAPK